MQTPYKMTLSSGQNSTDYRTRKLKNGSSVLAYKIAVAGYDLADWSDDPNSTDVLNSTGVGFDQGVGIYGTVDISKGLPSAGSYSDVLAITIHY